MNQKITTQNALMKSGEKKWANTEAEIEDIKKTVRKQTKTGKTKAC